MECYVSVKCGMGNASLLGFVLLLTAYVCSLRCVDSLGFKLSKAFLQCSRVFFIVVRRRHIIHRDTVCLLNTSLV